MDQPRLTWGSANPVAIAEARRAYVAALQAADRGELGPLVAFALSQSFRSLSEALRSASTLVMMEPR